MGDEIREIPVPASLLTSVQEAVAALPPDAPVCVFGVAEWEQGSGYEARAGVLVRIKKDLSFSGWLEKRPDKPLAAKAVLLWYPGRS